ncbi:MAG: peptide deformylase [Candidatus Yanofskybacteria bacterium RIFCSPLOWO2_01_FULL_49_17]|uniref:Peptide deformylase n=1 Tax=Candidatus Yanofskybacteria bacterium RIFCSPLOWO2_01_FULL_49_17 TaxID=1802700 RepID=A0A1F8GT20_9BACT|nr:MAG: peptide deformylase [Candidatus Yanofskybacteria bacterium RIFCSPLOWO2_01_FULL_49_17]
MEITKLPEEILGGKITLAEQEDIKNGKYAGLISDMKKAMLDNKGVGLAANQIGTDVAVFVIDEKLAEENKVPSAYFNPEITEYSKDSDELEEGCLSIPDWYKPVARSKKIMFKAIDEEGDKVKFRARGFLARVLQHETDHLNGLTIRDRTKIKS